MEEEATLRVVSRPKLEKQGTIHVLFEGSREQCYQYMRQYRNPAKWVELMYSNGRLSSWVLD